MGEKSKKAFSPSETYEPTDEWIISIADRLKQLPETIEQMDFYWFRRIAVLMEGEAMNSHRKARELEAMNK